MIVTNLPFHRTLNECVPIAALPFGLNMADFNRPGNYRLSVAWKLKQKHIDAYRICETLEQYACFPGTFFGIPPSVPVGRFQSLVVMCVTYCFVDD